MYTHTHIYVYVYILFIYVYFSCVYIRVYIYIYFSFIRVLINTGSVIVCIERTIHLKRQLAFFAYAFDNYRIEHCLFVNVLTEILYTSLIYA